MAGSRKEGKTVAYHEAVASLAVASLAVASLAAPFLAAPFLAVASLAAASLAVASLAAASLAVASLAVASLAVLLCSSGLHWHSSDEIQVTSDWLSSGIGLTVKWYLINSQVVL